MFEGLTDNDLIGAIEALLFVSDEPLNALDLASALDIDTPIAISALNTLKQDLADRDNGIQLIEIAGGWRLVTHPRYHDLIQEYVLSWDTRKLSNQALETLSIIAYLQPTTRNQISSIRGVSSDSSINSLLEKGLIKEAGYADSPGNPTLYKTTKKFLEKFGLNSTQDLTDLSEFAPDEETRSLIANRLSNSRNDIQLPIGTIDDEIESSFEEIDISIGGETLSESDTVDLIKDAIAQSLGTVEKIDLSKIDFDLSEE